MRAFCSVDLDIRLIGEGGNNRIYEFNGFFNGYSSAVIRVSKRCNQRSVAENIQKYNFLKRLGINTTAFLEECTFDGVPSLVTENLHNGYYTFLDANAHLLRDADILLRELDVNRKINSIWKEPEEERWFADNKFSGITNLRVFIQRHNTLLYTLADSHLYIASDCYFFKVRKQSLTELDYIIADWDDIGLYDDVNDLATINIEQFKDALLQFVDKYVEDDCDDYKGEIEQVFFEWNR